MQTTSGCTVIKCIRRMRGIKLSVPIRRSLINRSALENTSNFRLKTTKELDPLSHTLLLVVCTSAVNPWPWRRQQQKKFPQLFWVLPFDANFGSFFKDKKSVRSHKTVGIEVFFLPFLLDDWRIRGAGSGFVPRTNGYGSGRTKNIRIRNTGTLYTVHV